MVFDTQNSIHMIFEHNQIPLISLMIKLVEFCCFRKAFYILED